MSANPFVYYGTFFNLWNDFSFVQLLPGLVVMETCIYET